MEFKIYPHKENENDYLLVIKNTYSLNEYDNSRSWYSLSIEDFESYGLPRECAVSLLAQRADESPFLYLYLIPEDLSITLNLPE